MSQAVLQHEVPPAIEQKLGQVRRGIRTYVWLEGLAAIVITLAVAFWGGMLLDWLFEPSPNVRLAAMIGVGIVGLWVAYRQLLRRAFVRLSDSSLAVLLERHFRQLNDHLLTAVDLATGDDETTAYNPELVTRTWQAAASAVSQVNPAELFRRGPLARKLVIAAALAASIPIFAFAARDVFGFWVDRLALSTEPWPRRVHLEVVGFPPDTNGRRTQKVAHDDAFELIVHASTKDFIAPEQVEFRFQSADGGRGRDTMIRIGDAVAGRDDFQEFRYEFEDVTSSMSLDVLGGDDRVEDLHLEIVDRPELVGMEIECEYPGYLNRPPRRLPITGGMRIPEGTKLTLHGASTKPLTKIEVQQSGDSQATPLTSAAEPVQELNWDYGTLKADDVLTIRVTDTDGVACREPYRVSLAVVPDELPQVSVRLTGIGTAITPDAIVDGKYDPAFRFFLPGDGLLKNGTVRPEMTVDATQEDGELVARLDDVKDSGIYEIQLQPVEGSPERRAFAFNVPVGEGDLHIVAKDELAREFAGAQFQIHDAADMTINEQQLAGLQLSDALLATIVAILIVEQLLAYVASFHAPVVKGAKR